MVLFFMMDSPRSRFGLSLALTHAMGGGDSLMFVIARVNPGSDRSAWRLHER